MTHFASCQLWILCWQFVWQILESCLSSSEAYNLLFPMHEPCKCLFSACQRSKHLYHYFDISWCLHDNFRGCQPITLKFGVHDQELTGTNPIVCETCITMATINSLQNFFKMNSINFKYVFFEFSVEIYAYTHLFFLQKRKF